MKLWHNEIKLNTWTRFNYIHSMLNRIKCYTLVNAGAIDRFVWKIVQFYILQMNWCIHYKNNYYRSVDKLKFPIQRNEKKTQSKCTFSGMLIINIYVTIIFRLWMGALSLWRFNCFTWIFIKATIPGIKINEENWQK